MQIRTYLGILLSVVVAVYVSFLTPLNFDLLVEPFLLDSEHSIPVWGALLLVFSAGLLPSVTVLLVQTLKRDLSERRERRRDRETESLDRRFRRAVDFHVDGQWSKAAAQLDVLLTERPEDFATLLRCGEVLRHQGKNQEALEVHRRASVLYPHSVALLYQLAEDYAALGDAQVAREIRNRILRDFAGQGLEVLRHRRSVAMAAGRWDEASRWHEKAEAILKETGDVDGLEREAGVSQGLAYQQAVALLEKDRPADAAPIFRKLLQQEPGFVPAAIMLGEAELLLGNEETALDEWRQGCHRTVSPVFLLRIEDYFIEAEEPARAIETLRSLLANSEHDLLLRFFLGRLYFRLEMHDEALKVLEGIGERMDSAASYHFLLGRIRQRRKDYRGAMARYLACLKRLGFSNAAFACGSCEARYGEWQDRCGACGNWNSVDFDLEVEKPPEEAVDRPVWGSYGPLDDTRAIETRAEEWREPPSSRS